MKYAAFLALALGTLAFAAPAQADGKAAIKPPVVIAPTTLQGAPQPVHCCQQPAPVQAAPRVISRTVVGPEQGLKLDSDLVLSMSGGVGIGVADVGFGFGSGFISGASRSGGNFGRAQRFTRARQSGRSRGGRSGGHR